MLHVIPFLLLAKIVMNRTGRGHLSPSKINCKLRNNSLAKVPHKELQISLEKPRRDTIIIITLSISPNRPFVKLTQCSSKFIIVKVTKGENLRGGHHHFENKKTKSNKRTNKVIRTINSGRSVNLRACRCRGLFLSKTKYANLPALLVS